jgi:hypothetical protein
LGGYHGAPLKRYDELIMAFFNQQGDAFSAAMQLGTGDLSAFGTVNMLNTKYIVFGNNRNAAVENKHAYGNAWFTKEVVPVKNANEELDATLAASAKTIAIINTSVWPVASVTYDSLATITLGERKPNQLTYESNASVDGLALFSEIYYPKGWTASIDGKEAEIIRANYVLRALQIPSGKHTIVFEFKPAPYYIGNKVTMASSWLVLLILVGTIAWSMKKND